MSRSTFRVLATDIKKVNFDGLGFKVNILSIVVVVRVMIDRVLDFDGVVGSTLSKLAKNNLTN